MKNLISKKFKKSLFVASLSVMAASSNAALVTEDFSLTVLYGDYAGVSGTGSFSYDDANIFYNAVWEEWMVTRAEGLTINFTVFGQTFTEDDEIGIGLNDLDVPSILFNDASGGAKEIEFLVSENLYQENGLFSTVTEIDQAGITELYLSSYLDLGQDGDYTGGMFVTVSEVPVPAAAWLFGSALLGLVGVKRRK